jgi:hypothetical protein
MQELWDLIKNQKSCIFGIEDDEVQIQDIKTYSVK